jgi:lipopolysaccharide export system protein LptA
MTFRSIPLAVALLTCALTAPHARAEKADKDKPINFSSDTGGANYESKTGSLKGNVVLTQGTMTIRADRIDFKQNADNSISATVYGNPLSFRQKKDGSDEYDEGYAQRAVYDGQKDFLELFDRALLREGANEIRSNYITYNTSTGVFSAEGRPDAPGGPAGPGARVRGTFQPHDENMPQKGGAPAKGGAATPAKSDKSDKGDKGDNKAETKSAPLKLTPDSGLKQ